MKPWSLATPAELRALVMMLPFLMAKDRLHPTFEDWAAYQARVDSAPWN